MNAPVAKVTPAGAGRGPLVHAAGGGGAEEYDAVVFATHTDTTLAALGSEASEVASRSQELVASSYKRGFLAVDESWRIQMWLVPYPVLHCLQAVRAGPGALGARMGLTLNPELSQAQAVRAVLSALPYAENAVYLHTDAALMPCRRATWASWNCIQGSGAGADQAPICVTYWLNRLQDLPPGAYSIL